MSEELKSGSSVEELLNVYPLPWKSDEEGSYVFDSNGNMILEIRGWGRLKYFGEEVAISIQKDVQEYVVKAVNEHKKLKDRCKALEEENTQIIS